jgi:hypothetical protein
VTRGPIIDIYILWLFGRVEGHKIIWMLSFLESKALALDVFGLQPSVFFSKTNAVRQYHKGKGSFVVGL